MSRSDHKRQGLLVRVALLILGVCGVAAGGGILMMVPPTPTSFYPKCVSYQITGTHCPGCGTTRALHALLNGNLGQAFANNALAVLALPYVAVMMLRWVWYWLWGRSAPAINYRPWFTWSIAIVFILFWILRNIPVYPLTLLAPHELTP